MDQMIQTLAAELHVKPEHAQAVVALLDEGNTVPFIARYRKEQHGAMDDQTIRALADRWGVRIIGTELVGLTPAKALVDCAEYYLKLENFDCHKQVMEYHLVGME